jgi:hypothetical protein
VLQNGIEIPGEKTNSKLYTRDSQHEISSLQITNRGAKEAKSK